MSRAILSPWPRHRHLSMHGLLRSHDAHPHCPVSGTVAYSTHQRTPPPPPTWTRREKKHVALGECVFGISPCLALLSASRRKVHKLYVLNESSDSGNRAERYTTNSARGCLEQAEVFLTLLHFAYCIKGVEGINSARRCREQAEVFHASWHFAYCITGAEVSNSACVCLGQAEVFYTSWHFAYRANMD